MLVLPQLSVGRPGTIDRIIIWARAIHPCIGVCKLCDHLIVIVSVAVALPVFVVAVSIVQVGLSYTVIGAGQVIQVVSYLRPLSPGYRDCLYCHNCPLPSRYD